MGTVTFTNGHQYDFFADFDNYRFRTTFEPFCNDIILEAQRSVDAADDASEAAAAAAASVVAAAAAASSTGSTATSTTSLTVSTGSKSLTIQTGKSFVAGGDIKIARTSAPGTTFMVGEVTSYDSGTGALVVSVATATGSGTHTDWSVSLIQSIEDNSVTTAMIQAAAVTLAKLAAEAKRFWDSSRIDDVADGIYNLMPSAPRGYKILTVRSIPEGITAGTATTKIGTTALGGTANDLSDPVDVQAHSSANTLATDGELNVEFSGITGTGAVTLVYELELA